MDLSDIDRYLKVRALADHAGTPVNERKAAKARLAAMEADHAGIREAADRVQRAMIGESAPQAAQPPPKSGWGDLLREATQQAASTFADKFAGEVSGAGRFEPLARGDCVYDDHACGDGQVCLEVRMLARDVLRARWRAKILDEIEGKLIDLAEEA